MTLLHGTILCFLFWITYNTSFSFFFIRLVELQPQQSGAAYLEHLCACTTTGKAATMPGDEELSAPKQAFRPPGFSQMQQPEKLDTGNRNQVGVAHGQSHRSEDELQLPRKPVCTTTLACLPSTLRPDSLLARFCFARPFICSACA